MMIKNILFSEPETIEIEENYIPVQHADDWFGNLTVRFAQLIDDSAEYIGAFYDRYGGMGVLLAVIGIVVGLIIFFQIIKLIRFLIKKALRKRKKERIITKVNTVKIQSSGELAKWNKDAGDSHWENEIRKSVASSVSLIKFKGNETKLIEDLVSGKTPYQEYLSDVEGILFTLEEDIHNFVGKMSSVDKKVILKETVKLRVGLEKINLRIANLKRLAETFPEDESIKGLIELCEAFVQGSKGVEQGYIAALNA